MDNSFVSCFSSGYTDSSEESRVDERSEKAKKRAEVIPGKLPPLLLLQEGESLDDPT
jgi:hypothetical protein